MALAVIYDPRFHTFNSWASLMVEAYGGQQLAIPGDEDEWKTSQGLSYTKERMGYLLSTNPHARVGMAKPLKVVQQTTTLPFEAILTDVYRLSFMHVHSLLKTRLPITTHYADLSSTFHNRGLLNANTEHEEALPFV